MLRDAVPLPVFCLAEAPPPLHHLVLSAIAAVEPELHKELLRNVLVTGGLACLPGLPERFEEELRVAATRSVVPSIAGQAHRLAVLCGSLHERRNGVWLGASVLGSMTSHTDVWMSRAEYDEHGAALIGRKGMQHTW